MECGGYELKYSLRLNNDLTLDEYVALAQAGRNNVELARKVEATALRLLHERKPDRRIDTNVEFYTALLLHGLGLASELFTPTFAVGRVLGWAAHCLEQLHDGRLIRPQSNYIGPTDLHYDAGIFSRT